MSDEIKIHQAGANGEIDGWTGEGLAFNPSCRKPKKDEWFMVMTEVGQGYLYLIKDPTTGDFYYIPDDVRTGVLPDEPMVRPFYLFRGVSTLNEFFVWPIQAPDRAGRLNAWARKSLELATGVASQEWVRMFNDDEARTYRHMVLTTKREPYAFDPSKSVEDWVVAAFRLNIVRDENHALVQRLLHGKEL